MDVSFDSAKNATSQVAIFFNHQRFGVKKQLQFLEDLFVLIDDGIPPNRAIDMMVQATQGITRAVALHLSRSISEGLPLADGMKAWFLPNIVEIIRVGESGGALAQTIQSAVKSLSQRSAAMGSLIGAVAYPLLVIAMASGLMLYLNDSVFQQFRTIKPENQWPEAGQRLVALAEWMKEGWWGVIVGVVLLVIGMRYMLANYVGLMRETLDDYPPFSLYRKLVAAQFLETLGLLVNNGIVFKSALRVMQYQASPYLGMHLLAMENLLSTGKSNIADVLSTGLITSNDLTRLRVMSEVKGFEHGLVRMGIRGAEEATATIKLIARIFGGILLAVGGLLIVIVMQGVYLTGMSMGSM